MKTVKEKLKEEPEFLVAPATSAVEACVKGFNKAIVHFPGGSPRYAKHVVEIFGLSEIVEYENQIYNFIKNVKDNMVSRDVLIPMYGNLVRDGITRFQEIHHAILSRWSNYALNYIRIRALRYLKRECCGTLDCTHYGTIDEFP